MNHIIDERYTVADEAIFGAFFNLLTEKSIDKITVADVIKRAGIVRSTFYNHYENIPSLVSAIEDKTISDIFQMMGGFHPQNNYEICRTYFLALCNYTMENPFLSELLRTARGDSLFEKMLTMLHRYVIETTSQTFYTRHSKEEVSCAITCAIGSTIGLLHKWSSEHFATPKETIADVLTEVFLRGILPLMD